MAPGTVNKEACAYFCVLITVCSRLFLQKGGLIEIRNMKREYQGPFGNTGALTFAAAVSPPIHIKIKPRALCMYKSLRADDVP